MEKNVQKRRHILLFTVAAVWILCLCRTVYAQEMARGRGQQSPKTVLERYVPTEIIVSGICGENVRWRLSGGVLTIRGEGAVRDHQDERPPWDAYRGQIKEVVLEEGVTGVGAYAFASCGDLEKITFPSTLSVIGRHAFRGCYFGVPIMLDKLRVLMYDLTQRNEFYYFWEGSYNENEKSIICHAGGSYDDVFDGRLWFRLFRRRFQFRHGWG